eukprot:TRINITY_DN12352_c0_g1_i1.p1 TRINITY_DN12352_c0_g1~~TRINITY_DN12352_c0_g1_i1.p1  ORF type:complete len:119 (+),score=25.94 TRINITY_DN12352_c0_g1_i1:305-661(+)
MATKIKGFFKRFKHISQIFVYKEEHEMEIGYPTDVRHVSHIGSDGTSMNAPSWMNDFRTASDFSSRSISNLGQSRDRNNWEVASWSSQGACADALEEKPSQEAVEPPLAREWKPDDVI